ncbi:thiamine pyrophosphate-dependent dehydrogenase E1 component subunit alpha [Alteromonas sp. ASW11-19]|uniref:Thiamine pyrophosphate-dependent dehydrogenase E1 component subunit alpha n=1 Tax=Alteromonas salexigens TaxID=2982530 RepID=A0ABT2VNW9_9ALTE|nr:thiamine pyrophosphate-dependent dehydrogenase E1 component subunit alpha [Alteromonas salexigens]MCU7555005.1 thiamine pyrophosphate-dependent dehydrogenase E1 component subunit alpha [Alteromonas salexigens]
MNKLLAYYHDVLRIRLIEEAIATRYSDQQMRCPTHLSIGQEAAAVGVSRSLRVTDNVYSSHRAHAHYLAKGGSLKALIAELYGKQDGCTGGRGGSMHLTDLDAGFIASTAIVGNSIPLAVGNALHQQVQRLDHITVTYFGDGATEEGSFYEAANFAALKQLPVLFVCENNRFSVYSPMTVRQPSGRSIVELSRAIGLRAEEVDGNDVEAVHKASETLVDKVRKGEGPALLECHTYRHREHCGPNFDDQLGYRAPEEVEQWMQRDPVTQLHNKLVSAGVDESRLVLLKQQIEDEIYEAFAFAKASSTPNPDYNDRYLYA